MLALAALAAFIGCAAGAGVAPLEPEGAGEAVETKADRTRREVAALVAEFHARMPRGDAVAVGAAYARYSSRFQDSVADQVRAILEDALRHRVFVPLEFVFYDLGVRGFKADRPGLNGLRDCLKRKSATVALFFATNRLFRKTYQSLQFVEEQVVELGLRAIFVKSGVDTADATRWRAFLSMNSMMDEFVVTMNVENIRSAHEGLLAKQLVFGTVALGYRGEPIPGEVTRRGRPRHRLAVDDAAAEWVRAVFRWYVADRLTVAAIVRRMNADPAAPKPPKADVWSRPAVARLLRNPRYRGEWSYGVTETVWVSSKDYARQVARREPLKTLQVEELRLVGDEAWYGAQAILEGEAARQAGRTPSDPDAPARPRLLNGLFVCPEHDRRLYVGGPGGGSLFCKDCQGLPADRRPIYSLLPRDVALAKTCSAVATLVRADPDLVDAVVEACRAHVLRQARPDPGQLSQLEGRLAKLDHKVQFVLRNPGEAEADQRESESELRRLRKERASLAAEAESARAASARPVQVPTPDEVRGLLSRLAHVLEGAAAASPESAGRVRELIDALTGGRVELFQRGERRPKRGWLQGRFANRVAAAAAKMLTGANPAAAGGGPEVTIDYQRDRDDDVTPELRDEVVAAYRAGAIIKEIARRSGLSRARVAAVLDADYAARGEDRPDGRTRRSTLAAKHIEPPLYQRVADRVKELADGGLLLSEVAAKLGIDRNTATAAWKHWHESRGLVAPDGRARRKTLAKPG